MITKNELKDVNKNKHESGCKVESTVGASGFDTEPSINTYLVEHVLVRARQGHYFV